MPSVAPLLAVAIVALETMTPLADGGGASADRRIIAALDREYQAAVLRNDADTMARILHEEFWLVLGNGTLVTRDELLAEARAGAIHYERQDEVPGTQSVRVWGDTAVVTAKLRIKGTREGKEFDRLLWFSDTYVRTPGGWRYAFGQASLPIPDEVSCSREDGAP